MCAALLVPVLLVGGCEREQRRFAEFAPSSAPARTTQPSSGLRPERGAPDGASRAQGPYDGNAWAISEGQRYFVWFNCNGCHGMGGGGSGPALMDATWRYGSDPEAIYATIVGGRPNGMPAFRGKIPEQQVWQLVAYVRALSGLVPLPAAPGRSDSLSVRPPPAVVRHNKILLPWSEPAEPPP